MADAALFTFSYQETVEALIKQQGLHEGFWQLYIEFGLGAANISTGPSPDSGAIVPAAIVPVNKIGLKRVDKENNLTVDAAKVNPL